MIIDRKSDNVVGSKSARACDSCIRRRARWYCTADDAFLCQGCDMTVHSANQLASRHERVRLGTSNFIKDCQNQDSVILLPAWHQGFTKKARTRRRANNNKSNNLAVLHEGKNEEKSLFAGSLPLVPEISSEETSSSSPFDENHQEAGLVSPYQVPVFFYEHGEISDLERFLLPSEMELAEFAADMESLLGGDMKKNYNDEEKDGMHSFGQCENGQEKGGMQHFYYGQGERVLKIEEKEDDEGRIEAVLACQFDPMRETFDWNIDYDEECPMNEEDEKAVMVMNNNDDEMKVEMGKNLCLKLNYDGVINSWPNQKSPWITGTRPDLNADDCWTDIMGMSPTNYLDENGVTREGIGGQVGSGDGAREARVSRYREKRRTRLFSKKIRYEVRKLNAEKRPRMRGRFVKRTSFAVLASAGLPQHI